MDVNVLYSCGGGRRCRRACKPYSTVAKCDAETIASAMMRMRIVIDMEGGELPQSTRWWAGVQ